ncbi:MAG: sensor histidine kinase [Bacteroidia bacterium]|jgi:signal transduction histidine kinase
MDTSPSIDLYFILFVGTAGMLLLACTSIVLFVVYNRKSVRAREEKFNMEKAFQEQLIFSNLKTLEEERTRFARDVHDEIGVNLSTIGMRIKGFNKVNDPEIQSGLLEELVTVVDHSIQSTRRIAHNLIPPGLEKFGLSYILEEQIKPLVQGSNLRIVVEVADTIQRPGFEEELMIYRILQELLHNTLKYANATIVHIDLDVRNHQFCVIYRDNGIGFDLDIITAKGLGIRNMESRAKMIGAVCALDSTPGKGMKATLTLPLPR